MLCICGASTVLTGMSLQLEPRILAREVIFYSMALLCLYFVLQDNELALWQTIMLLVTYVVYVLVCAYYGKIVEMLCPFNNGGSGLDLDGDGRDSGYNPLADIAPLSKRDRIMSGLDGNRRQVTDDMPVDRSFTLRGVNRNRSQSWGNMTDLENTRLEDAEYYVPAKEVVKPAHALYNSRLVINQAKRMARIQFLDQNDADEMKMQVRRLSLSILSFLFSLCLPVSTN